MTARSLMGVFAAVALVCAGCGSSGEKSSGGAAGGTGSTSTKADVTVKMRDIEFLPKRITVKRGQTVGWVNSDGVAHNVTKEQGPGSDFHSSTMNQGATYAHTFTKAGTFDYVCTIHPNQKGVVTVR